MGKLRGDLFVGDFGATSGSQISLRSLLVLVLVNTVPLHIEVTYALLVLMVEMILRVSAAVTLRIFGRATVLFTHVHSAELLVDGDISVAVGVPLLEGLLWIPVIIVGLKFLLEGDHLVLELTEVKPAISLVRTQKIGHVVKFTEVAGDFVVVVQTFDE